MTRKFRTRIAAIALLIFGGALPLVATTQPAAAGWLDGLTNSEDFGTNNDRTVAGTRG